MNLTAEQILPRIGVISPATIRAPAFRLIDRMQHMDPAIQITATAVALCAMSEALGLNMRHVINVAENTLRDAEGPYTEHIQAIREYAKGEILRRGE
jgi:hypothetical protein